MAARFEPAGYVRRYEGVLLRPSFTVWNRLELSPFSDDLARSLANEVRDPLWMLARQWQVGEFQGEDAGAPLTARLAWEETPLTTLAAPGGAETPLGDAAPLEATVESEPVNDHLLLALRLGAAWLRGLSGDPDLAGAAAWFAARFRPAPAPEGTPTNLAEARAAANRERTLWLGLAARKRLPDGLGIVGWLRAGMPDGPPGLSRGARDRLEAFGARFLAAHDGQFVPPAPAGFHDRARFEYRFAVGTGGCVGDPADPRLVADEHDGTRIDWSTFDLSGDPAGAGQPAGGRLLARTYLPQPARFPGMPADRWWEFEDRRIDLGAIMAGRTDLARMLLVEFGLLYANDWFVLPLPLPSRTLARVAGVVVTDEFGLSTWVPPEGDAAAGADASSLFTLTRAEDGGLTRRPLLVVPPVAMTPMEGAATDRVLLLRDEGANMAWAVEHVVPDGLGGGMDARAAADRTRALLDAPAGGRPDEDGWGSDAAIRWRLRTRVPDGWIPLVPARRPGRDGIVFQQGAMPWSAPPHPLAKILPRSALLGRTVADLPFLVEEEEVPRSGAVVERGFTRVRWHDGRTCVWLGRSKRNGRGPGSSGLAFDGLVERPAPAKV